MNENVTENVTENVIPPVDEDTGAGTGINVETTTTTEQFNQARVELTNTLSEANDSQETVLLVPDEQDELDEDLSHDNSEDDENETITYQGITYTIDTEDNSILDDLLTEIGKWDGKKIEFHNSEAAKDHRIAVLELKAKEE